MPSGYYRYPTICQDTVVFVCEDDLWTVSAGGGVARRLTANLGEVTRPSLSPDGKQLAFVGREEGQAEVYLMPALGGPARRLTYLAGSGCIVLGWTADGKIVFANNVAQPFRDLLYLYTVSPEGEPPQRINVGPARSVAFGSGGRMVIGRNTGDPARWKRYRGGTAGQLWIDPDGDGNFRPLIALKGNLASPMWLRHEDGAERIYFLSDHEGYGNLYSCLPSGEDLRRHTDHADFYARNAATDGRRIVYHAGADLYLFDPASGETTVIPIELHSPQVQRSRKFVKPARYLESAELHPKGQFLAVTARGKLFTFANWEGAVIQHGTPDGVRYRLPSWLNDGERLIAVTDDAGEERFIILHADASKPVEYLDGLDIGRPEIIAVNPKKDVIAFSNHRYELMVLDLASRELKKVDRGAAAPIAGFDWSPDGEWLAYSVSISLQVTILKLWQAASGESVPLTTPLLRDVAPAFDPEGKYLYFLSYRHFNPVYDNLHFDLNFPQGIKPFLITLQKDLPSPFVPQPRKETPPEKPADEKPANPPAENQPAPAEAAASGEVNKPEETGEKVEKKEEPRLQIDLDGISQRMIAFPVEEGLYGRILGLRGGKVLFSVYPVEGALGQNFFESGEPPAKGTLLIYSFEDLKADMLIANISDFALSRDASTMIYRAGNRLRVLKAGEKPEKDNGFNRKSGWIDLDRVKVSVIPLLEWRQMFREAWRLQRDHFWTPDMSQVDWMAVYDRYLPLVDRVATRSEFSDLIWELQGELATSHCYEFGGDYRPSPNYAVGCLGADFAYDAEADAWRITHIVRGDSWDEAADSPLNRPGVNLQEGDLIKAVNGRPLSRDFSPIAALVNLAGSEVTLTVLPKAPEPSPESQPPAEQGKPESPSEPAARVVTVKALSSELAARYRSG